MMDIETLNEEEPFDLLLTDTSLFQSFTGAIQSIKGKRILQIDENSFYGGNQAGTHRITVPTSSPDHSILHDPSPIIFYARGPVSDLLLSLQLNEYLEFMAIEQEYLWLSEQTLIPLPHSKEQVMLEPSLTLLEKRKLSKLLNLASDLVSNPENLPLTFTLGDLFKKEGVQPESRVFQIIAYSACRCSTLTEVNNLTIHKTVTILESLRESLNHLSGRACSPFVLPLWGSSELSQAACRKAAVFGCTQILEKSLKDMENAKIKFKNSIAPRAQSENVIFRACWLLNKPILGLFGNVLITIPPACDLLADEGDSSTFNFLQLTSDSKCCPDGTWLLHFWSLKSSQNSIQKFAQIESLLIIDSSSIIWTSPLEEVSIPTYTASFSTKTNTYQPIMPASHISEHIFTSNLTDLTDEI